MRNYTLYFTIGNRYLPLYSEVPLYLVNGFLFTPLTYTVPINLTEEFLKVESTYITTMVNDIDERTIFPIDT